MKTQHERNALKDEIELPNAEPRKLSDAELKQVTSGGLGRMFLAGFLCDGDCGGADAASCKQAFCKYGRKS